MDKSKVTELRRIANNVRRGIIEGVYNAACGHPGGSLSIADILTYLYFEEMNVDPKAPKMSTRDRFVLSKGHTAPALYATLAARGFFPREDLSTLRKIDSYLQGHPDMKGTPGVDMSTGSLGQGISTACGMALAGKLDKKDYRVYAILGDGEIEEGQVWEALMFAAHKNLSNLCVMVDYNGLQIDGPITEVMSSLPIADKMRAFNFNTIEIDGNDMNQIADALAAARACTDKPTAIVLHTVKGKGVSYMENVVSWHGNPPNAEQMQVALDELGATLKELEDKYNG